MKPSSLWLVMAVFMVIGGTSFAGEICADHSIISQFDQIESAVIADIQNNYRIYYGHTSHGSQIMSGLDYVEGEAPLYAQPVFHERSDDLGHNGDTSWVPDIRSWLDGHPDYNMVMMSWCGGASDNTESGINIYLNKMGELETDYPTVTFIYMTGHLDGGGVDGLLYQNNNQIRDYCSVNDKILFDFADIESYDPDGTYYPNESDACGWCSDWCTTHSCCTGSCAHSHCFNCYQKGKAWWWMMATIEGWSLALDVNEDDENSLPDSYCLHQCYPNPFNPSTQIRYDLPCASNVQLSIYNIVGQEVRVLSRGQQGAGHYQQEWDGCTETGQPVTSGLYFYRLQADDYVASKKMLLVK